MSTVLTLLCGMVKLAEGSRGFIAADGTRLTPAQWSTATNAVHHARALGMNPKTALQFVGTESSFNPMAANPKSSARGPLQYLKGTAADLGITNRYDMRESLRAFQRQMQKNNATNLYQQAAVHYLGPAGARRAAVDTNYAAKLSAYYRKLQEKDALAQAILGQVTAYDEAARRRSQNVR